MNVRLNWVLPPVSSRQRPIAHVLIEVRTVVESGDPLPWSAVNTVAPPETTLLIEQLAPGLREFRGTVVDDAGRRSNPKVALVDVPFDAPGDLVEFTYALE